MLKRRFEDGSGNVGLWAFKRPCSGITDDTAVRSSRASSTSDASSTMMDLDGNGECMDGKDVEGDALLSVITGKRPLQQIDQLVDDLIRKTNKTLDWGGINSSGSKRSRDREVAVGATLLCGEEGLLPGNIRGTPHPSTDRLLLAAAVDHLLLPPVVVGRKDGDLDSPEVADMGDASAGAGAATRYSGDVSHSDWPIEEVKQS